MTTSAGIPNDLTKAYKPLLTALESQNTSNEELSAQMMALKTKIDALSPTTKEKYKEEITATTKAIRDFFTNPAINAAITWIENPNMKASKVNQMVSSQQEANTKIKAITQEISSIEKENGALQQRKETAATSYTPPSAEIRMKEKSSDVITAIKPNSPDTSQGVFNKFKGGFKALRERGNSDAIAQSVRTETSKIPPGPKTP